ncbi:MAG: bifunctional riboflavin kinase/FAD synthetase [Pseudomonadota bacterium]
MVTRLIRGLINMPSQLRGGVVAIGNFDGVHKGHQALLAKVKAEAKRLNAPALVIIFEPQTGEFFAKGKPAVPRLTRWREKFHALAKLGMDGVVVLRFTQAFSNMTADQFITEVLQTGMDVRQVMVGDDFRFGKGRQGDFEFLQKRGAELGFSVANMASVMVANERVSSTRIRQALATGQDELVTRLLGHPYFMQGRVMHGDQLGRTIGFPTANIFLHRKVAPLHGVYVVRMHGLGKQALPGVANIGTRPTVGGTRTLLEVHLFNFDADIYGRQVRVEFCKKLRDEEYYESLDLLKVQIEQDAKAAKEYFTNFEKLYLD